MRVDQREKSQAECFVKKVTFDVLPLTGLHIVMATVTKSSSDLVPFKCASILLVSTSTIRHHLSHGCTYATSLGYVVSHCKHYLTEFFWGESVKLRFLSKVELDVFPLVSLYMVWPGTCIFESLKIPSNYLSAFPYITAFVQVLQFILICSGLCLSSLFKNA